MYGVGGSRKHIRNQFLPHYDRREELGVGEGRGVRWRRGSSSPWLQRNFCNTTSPHNRCVPFPISFWQGPPNFFPNLKKVQKLLLYGLNAISILLFLAQSRTPTVGMDREAARLSRSCYFFPYFTTPTIAICTELTQLAYFRAISFRCTQTTCLEDLITNITEYHTAGKYIQNYLFCTYEIEAHRTENLA